MSAASFEIVVDTNIWLDILVFDDPGARRLAGLLGTLPTLRPPLPLALQPLPLETLPLPSTPLQPPPPHISAVSSDAMRAELADVVIRPRFKLDLARRTSLLARYDEIVRNAPAAPDCRLACRDPDDRKFLDLAVARRVAWLLSKDRALLAVRKHAWRRFALRIGGAADFYAWLDRGALPST